MYRPGLILPGDLDRQAGNIFVPNRFHPFMLANPKLLAVCHGARDMYDYITHTFSTHAGTTTPRVSPRIGWGIDCTGATGAATWNDAVNAALTSVTMFAVCIFDTAAANRDFVCDTGVTNAGRRFRYNTTSGTIELFNGGVSGGNIDSGVAPVLNVPYFIAVSANKFTGQACFVFRNLLTGAVTTATATNSTTPSAGDAKFTVGGGPTTFDGTIAMAGIAAGWLPLRALVDWSADPWGVFEPNFLNITSTFVASSGISGTASITLADFTLSATGVEPIKGTAGITLADFTLSATGVLPIKGSLSATLADFTLSATGTGQVTTLGTANITLADFTLSAASVLPIKGAATITLSDFTLSALSALAVKGAASLTLDAFTLSASGTLTTPSTPAIINNVVITVTAQDFVIAVFASDNVITATPSDLIISV